MNHLSNYVRNKHFLNVDVVDGSYHSKLGKRPDVLYLNLEPFTKELKSGYIDFLIDKIIQRKTTISKKFNVKWIVIDDILTICCV